MLWAEPTVTPKAPNTPPPPPTFWDPALTARCPGSDPSVQLLPAGRWLLRDGGLGQLSGTKPTTNLHKQQKRTSSPFSQLPATKRDARVTKAHEVTKN